MWNLGEKRDFLKKKSNMLQGKYGMSHFCIDGKEVFKNVTTNFATYNNILMSQKISISVLAKQECGWNPVALFQLLSF